MLGSFNEYSRAHVENQLATPEQETLALAPAAGAGVGKAIADYLLSQPHFIEDMGQVILRAIKAKTRHWDREAREFILEEDCKTQLAAFFGCVAHMEGEPVKRIIHQFLGGQGRVDPLAALRESPALREAAADMLRKADWRTSGRQEHKRPKKAEPVVDGDEV